MNWDEAPDIRILWDKTPVARKQYRCDRCGEMIEPGTKYSTVGLREDGAFRHDRTHRFANFYPSGCPTLGERDRAEIAKDHSDDH
jgi:hypothetical protein